MILIFQSYSCFVYDLIIVLCTCILIDQLTDMEIRMMNHSLIPTWVYSNTIHVLRCSFLAHHAKTIVDTLRPYLLGKGKTIEDLQVELPLTSHSINTSTSPPSTRVSHKQILLHPRLSQLHQLDPSVIACVESLGAHWDCVSLAELSDLQKLRLATIVFFSHSKLQSALRPESSAQCT